MTASIDTTPVRCERCGQTADQACYMPPRRCPRPEPAESTELDDEQPKGDAD